MTWVWGSMAVVGALLVAWAEVTLPKGISRFPKPIGERFNGGPYRFTAHPMYVGSILFITGLGGLAAGFWNALALFSITELVLHEWQGREEGK